jgi:hypothetical protein
MQHRPTLIVRFLEATERRIEMGYKVKVLDRVIDLPGVVTGEQLLDTPAVQALVPRGETPFLKNPRTREMEIIVSDRNYQIQDGLEIDAAPRTTAG